MGSLIDLYTRQHDQYPADLTAAYNMLLNYKPTTRARYDDKKLKEIDRCAKMNLAKGAKDTGLEFW
eukprot:scaffold1521_cov271-Chaetoceros_neogracile.AAC.59